MSFIAWLPIAGLLLVLWNCSGAAPAGPEGGAVGETGIFSNAAGPVERPTVMTDTGPQGGCPSYCRTAEAFEHPELTSEECKKLYDDPVDLCGIHRLLYERPDQEVNIPQRVIQEIDCSEHFVEGKGYNPEAVPSLCREPYISWWNSTHTFNSTFTRPAGLEGVLKEDFEFPATQFETLTR